MIKKLLATVLLGAIGTVFASSIVMAQGLNSSLGVQTYTMFEGTANVVPIDSTYESGSSTTRWAKGWFTDLDISGVLTFGGVMGSDLDLDGYDLVLDTDGDTALLNDRDAGVADDEVDVQIAGAVDFTLSANTLTAVDGSSVVVEDGNVAVQVDDNTNAIALDLDNDDSTNNPSTLKIANAGSGLDIDKVAGILKFGGSGATNNEDLIFDLETGANVAGVTSTTGVVDITFTGIDVNTTTEVSAEHIISTDDADINDNLTVGDVIIDEASGVLDFTGASGATITSSGFGAISFGDENLSTTGTFSAEDVASTDDADINDSLVAGDITIDEATGVLQCSGATSCSILSDSDALTIGGVNGAANSENLVFDFETVANEVDITSGTGVTNLEISGMTLDMDASDILHTDSIFGSTASLPVRIGDGGTTTAGLVSEDDLLVTGKLEVQGNGYYNNILSIANGLFFSSPSAPISTGSGNTTYNSIVIRNASQTPNNGYLATGSLSNSWIIGESTDKAYDFAHALQTNPTLFIHSANQSATQWVSLTHDQTNAVIDTGTGRIKMNDVVGITDGTAGAPSLTFSNDPNSGIYSYSADHVGVSTAGTVKLDVGTTATTSALDLNPWTNNTYDLGSTTATWAESHVQDAYVYDTLTFGDNTDKDVTIFTLDRLAADFTLKWNETDDQFEFDAPLYVTGAMTATSFGGITEANLVDKSATEAVTGAWDFGGGGLEVPNGTTIPATCSVGQVYLDTDSDDCVDTGAGDGAYCICKSSNVWSLVADI